MHTPLHLTDDEVRRLGDGDLLQRDAFASAAEVRGWSAGITLSDAAFTFAGVGKHGLQGSGVRTDRTAWESDLPGVFPGMRERFADVRTELNQAAWTGLAAFTVQLATYAAGGHYHPHRDALQGDDARRITAILYLNAHWRPRDGGCLRIHPDSGTKDVERRGGRLVIFRAGRLLHEVLPSHATRHAATAWFRGVAAP